MSQTEIERPNHYYYTTEFKSLKRFFSQADPPCKSCIVSVMCVQFGCKTQLGYQIMKVSRPCEDFDNFIEGCRYSKVIYKHIPNDKAKPVGYGKKLWGS